MRLVLGFLVIDQRFGRISPDPGGIAHHESHRDHPAHSQNHQPQYQTIRKGHARRIRCNHGREGVDGGSKDADTGPQQDHGHGRQGVIFGGDHDRDKQDVEGKRLLRHPVGGATQSEQRHKKGDHPVLAPLQPDHRPRNACIYRSGRRDHPDEAADDQHEKRHVDRIRGIGDRIIEACDGSQDHIEKTLRIGVREGIAARHRHILAQSLGGHALILPSRNNPGQCSHKDDQREQYGKGGWEAEPRFLGGWHGAAP